MVANAGLLQAADIIPDCHDTCVQDVAQALEQTLDLPSILPHGARVDPTTDGFLLWLPSSMSLPLTAIKVFSPLPLSAAPFTRHLLQVLHDRQ